MKRRFLPVGELSRGLSLFAKGACLMAVVYFVLKCIDASDNDDIAVRPTPSVIESIRPIGQLYAFTAITEDFTIDNVEKVGFFTRSYYKAVQTMRMQVSYVLDLDSVKYVTRQGSDTVLVRLPRLRYVQTAQGGNLLCEVEVANYDAARAIRVVEQKIRSKYDSQENRQKAMSHVRDVLTAFVQQCGLIPRFEERSF
ncbi:MAG: hypothetical protein K6D37_06565 [Prevotella sp.]|nr:hypothetical protein [Prevotella sp.]